MHSPPRLRLHVRRLSPSRFSRLLLHRLYHPPALAGNPPKRPPRSHTQRVASHSCLYGQRYEMLTVDLFEEPQWLNRDTVLIAHVNIAGRLLFIVPYRNQPSHRTVSRP